MFFTDIVHHKWNVTWVTQLGQKLGQILIVSLISYCIYYWKSQNKIINNQMCYCEMSAFTFFLTCERLSFTAAVKCDYVVCVNGLTFAASPLSPSSFSVITVGLWRGFVLWVTWGNQDNIWWGRQQNSRCFVERFAAAKCARWHRVKYRLTLGRCFHLYKRQQKCVQPHR